LMNKLSYCVDNARLSRLGFELRGSLEDGIGDTVAMLTGAQVSPAAIRASQPLKGRGCD